MKQSARIISVYASDTSGVCSMLYELGGMVVVHDASGCNSTYSTHDEPRWYRMDSMIYISALTETDAVLGNDEKLIRDIAEAAKELSPRFIAVCGAPIPLMTGTDFDAVAAEIEQRCGIPVFGLHTSGMHSYLTGASEALCALLRHFVRRDLAKTGQLSVNIIGATPLDFSIGGTVDSMKTLLNENGLEMVSCMAMGSTLDDIARAGTARVNLVVSSAGLAAARWLEQEFRTPWVAGVPLGRQFAAELIRLLKQSAGDGVSRCPCTDRTALQENGGTAIVGESIFAGSLARAMELELGKKVRVLCPLETDPVLLADGDVRIPDEADAIAQFRRADEIIADPMYQTVSPAGIPFRRLPHEAFSGRCYRKEIPDLIGRELKGITGIC